MPKQVIVAHYHELWLKGGNRNFFLAKLITAVRGALEGLPVERIRRPENRLVIELGAGADLAEVLSRLGRVFGIANFAWRVQ